MVDKCFLKTYCEEISFCYIDTLMNEVNVLVSISEIYKDIKYYLIEIDYKESFDFVNSFLLNLDYSLKKVVGKNYLYVKKLAFFIDNKFNRGLSEGAVHRDK